jgi:hypothetical protein
MKCVILQPSYIPWRGYFHQIQKADVFVFYDDVQYDNHGWRNRNRVKGPNGAQWLTIPVNHKGSLTDHTLIKDVRICSKTKWNSKHLRTLRQLYGKTPYFGTYLPLLEPFYQGPPSLLSDFTIDLTVTLARELGVRDTRFCRSSELGVGGRKTERLVGIVKKVGANHYISGPSAKSYLEEEKLAAEGITLEYMVYDYPPYPQLYPPFDPQVSVLDLLFMTGPRAPAYIWNEAGQVAREAVEVR